MDQDVPWPGYNGGGSPACIQLVGWDCQMLRFKNPIVLRDWVFILEMTLILASD